MIERDYHYTFYADDLPNAFQFKEANAVNIKYENGVPVGEWDQQSNQFYLFNHLDITIQVNQDS